MSPFRDEPIVTLATFDTEFEASLARGALEAIGIRAMVPGEDSGSYVRRARVLQGVELKVFESDRERAAIELRRLQMRVAQPPDDES
jgi:hypothetical protein